MRVFYRLALVLALCSLALCGTSYAQSTAATIFGTVFDEQHNVLPGATVTVRNTDTGQSRTAATDRAGNFRFVGLAPGPYELKVELQGFATLVESNIVLTISQEAQVNPTLKIAQIAETIVVTGESPLVETTKATLGRTITTKELDELPIVGRNFTNLAQLSPGILGNASTGGTGIAAAGQTGRNNSFLIDGLSNNDYAVASTRGQFSVDAIKEFVVLSNNFAAEYGQASGAVVNVLTRSGSNKLQGRGSYYHRDDALDATPASARLVTPPLKKAKLAQQVVSAFVGGPIRQDRAFFFGSIDHTLRDQEAIITSPLLSTFRPDQTANYPVPIRNPQILGRGDVNLSPSNLLTVRYRLDRDTRSNWYVGGLADRTAGTDRIISNQDVAVLNNHVFGSRGLNEFRAQFARRFLDWNVDDYCPKCFRENRPSINLGKAANMPQGRTEDRWQLADSFTYMVPDKAGDHSFKAGFDLSFITMDSIFHNNLDGTFTFQTDRVFNPNDATTYPRQFTKNVGDPQVRIESGIYALFFQDQWRLRRNLTFNLGVRWDYEDTVGISQDKNNVAPRIGFSFDPWDDGKTSVRGGIGSYYDKVFLNIPLNAENAKKFVGTLINDPGYPDPYGYNPNRVGGPITPTPSTVIFDPDLSTPNTRQASIGVQREVYGQAMVSADYVWSRGYNLLLTKDLNYPDLTNPARPRPNPNYQRMNSVMSVGHSWYQALQVQLVKRHSKRHSYSVAYTLSNTERDTEDFGFIAQDQRDYAAERGPSLSDARHFVSASLNVDLWWGIRLATFVTARSKLPYNITTGRDDNRDSNFNDRPPDTGRNAGRGATFESFDVRLAKDFRFARYRVEILAEAYNVFNEPNWGGFIGNMSSASFKKQSTSGDPRQVQLGVRFDF